MTDTDQQPEPQLPSVLLPRDESALAVPEDPLVLGEYARSMLGLPVKDEKDNLNAHILAGKILTGREIGLPAMLSTRAIHIIKGMPTVGAPIQLALIRRSAQCKYFKIHPVLAEGGDLVVKAEAERMNGEKQSIVLRRSEFQHLLGKDVWKQYPKRMLSARAITFLARDLFSDVVAGIEATEERQDLIEDVQYYVEQEAPKVASSPIIQDPAPAPKVAPPQAPPPPNPHSDPSASTQQPTTPAQAETVAPAEAPKEDHAKTPPRRATTPRGKKQTAQAAAPVPAEAPASVETQAPPEQAGPPASQESTPFDPPAGDGNPNDQGFMSFDDPPTE